MSEYITEPIEWLWEPYIPSGTISLIQGDGGEGKTTISVAVAAAVTLGAGLPGKDIAIPRSNVIMQNAEDSYTKLIHPKLEMFGADLDTIHVIDADEEELSFTDERIEQSIIRTRARLVILDPVQAYFGGKNMNSTGDVRPIMKQLGGVAARTGCAVLLVGHMNKGGGKSQYRGLGSIDIYAAARSVLTVGRIDVDETMRAVVHNKSNLSAPGASLAFGLDPVDGFCWLGEYDITIDELLSGKQKPESQFTKARRLIETVLANGAVPAIDMEQMAADEGISLKTLNRAKSALGVLSTKRGDGWYWILPIEADYSEVSEDSQHGQDGHGSPVSALAILTRKEAV
jgi:hypothetical protein